MLADVTVAPDAALFSNAHCCTAPSIWRRLLMQAFCCEVVRALMKFGIAIAARRPMMATTIMISTSVKPDLEEVLIFISSFFLHRKRQLAAGVGCQGVRGRQYLAGRPG